MRCEDPFPEETYDVSIEINTNKYIAASVSARS